MWLIIDRLFASRRQHTLWLINAALILSIAIVDDITGFEVASSPFYFIPVGISAWYGTSAMATAACIASAAGWLWADIDAGHVYSSDLIPIWNSLVRLLTFAMLASLMIGVRNMFLRQSDLANTDHLTGLSNSRAFLKRMSAHLSRALPTHSNALCYLDLDHFKQVNDSLGHTEGDRVLKLVGQLLRAHVRQGDLVGRLGGDEFALLLIDADADAAQRVCDRVRAALRAEAQRAGWPVTMSIGVAVFSGPLPSADAAIQRADTLMYRVKTNGKDSVLIETTTSAEPLTPTHPQT
jgi:diguanylate cyclase (GGDEF)-like protein